MPLSITKYCLGVDVSSDKIDVCFKKLTTEQDSKVTGKRKFVNTPRGIAELIPWIKKHQKQRDVPFCVVMEATGVYHENLAVALHEAGFKVVVALPTQTSVYLKSLGNKSKTDAIDAKGLAQMGLERKMRSWSPPNAQMRQLRNLTRQRATLQGIKTDVGNRLHAHQKGAFPSEIVVQQLKQQFDFIDMQIEQMDQAIEQLLANAGTFGQKVKGIADSWKGIGIVSIATVIAELDGCQLFHSEAQVVSFSGYDVIDNQSGQHKGKTKISKKGNVHIRRVLHFPALNMVRWNIKPFSNLFNRVFQRTNIKMKGYVAVQRKILCIIYHLWKNDTTFDPNFEQNKRKKLKALKQQQQLPLEMVS